MTIHPGKVYIQIYRADVPGSTDSDKVINWFAQFDALNERQKRAIGGIIPHGFNDEFSTEKWQLWANEAKKRSLQCGAAWGVSDTTNASHRGSFYGAIAALPDCEITLLDVETSSWEQSGSSTAATDLCTSFRAAAPRGFLVCQTWHVPTSHMGVPYTTFQNYIDAFSSMDYVNESGFVSQYGTNRYWILSGWFASSWGELQKTTLGPARKNRAIPPRIITYQSYGWSDILTSLVSALVNASALPIVLWQQKNSEASPSWWIPSTTWTAIERYQALCDQNFVGLNAIWNYQTTQPSLTVDGLAGTATAQALGVP